MVYRDKYKGHIENSITGKAADTIIFAKTEEEMILVSTLICKMHELIDDAQGQESTGALSWQ